MRSNPRFERVVTDVVQRQLEAFSHATPGVVSAVLLSADGFELAGVGKGSAARLAAMGSSLSALGSAIAMEAGIADCRRMIIEADGGTVVVMSVPYAKPPMSLAVVASEDAALGQLLWTARNCCEAIGRASRE